MAEKALFAGSGLAAFLPQAQRILGAGLVCAALVAFSILFIDRPVEAFVAQHQNYRLLFQAMASPSLLSLPCACLVLLSGGARAAMGWRPGREGRLLLSLGIAIVSATAFKDELKYLFGRPWPRTWLEYGLYNFHPLNNGNMFGSFPSGHTTYITAPMCVLWFKVPKYRPLWAALITMVMVGLVGGGYHFVGDVIAGFFTGLTAAYGTVMLMPREKF